jgi:hypothetical protein
MRGDILHLVYGVHAGRENDVYFGSHRSEEAARRSIRALEAREMHGTNWAARYHDQGFVVRTAVVDTDFEIPTLPKPRDAYTLSFTKRPNREGTWDSTIIDVYRRATATLAAQKVASFVRDYAPLQTFEPFRRGGREYALVSPDYTRTSVLDLTSGEMVAHEEEGDDAFCPVGFYVPDWWDVNDGSILPGSPSWSDSHEWPKGDLAFVWGCVWGDDQSWKLQCIDLTRMEEGILVRDQRFGYLELATGNYQPPWTDPTRSVETRSPPPPFLTVSYVGATPRLDLHARLTFELESGVLDERQRLCLNRVPGAEWE